MLCHNLEPSNPRPGGSPPPRRGEPGSPPAAPFRSWPPVPPRPPLTFPAGLLERHRAGQVAAVHRHAGAVVAQGAALRLPGVAGGDVAAGAAVDAVLVGGGIGAGREEAAHGGEPRGGLGTGTDTRRARGDGAPTAPPAPADPRPVPAGI